MTRGWVRAGAGAVFAVVLGLYLLTMSGHTYSPDEETMLATAEAVGLHGTFALPPSRTLVEVPGADHRYYSQYGPGQPVAALPWVWLGHGLAGLLGLDPAAQGFVVRFVLGSFNLVVGAALAALLFAVARGLGAGRRGALAPAALLAFGTFLWPMSRTFFAEPLTALLLFGAFAALAVRPRPLLAGALGALALSVKIQYVVALPALGLLAAWLALAAWRAGERRVAARRIGGFALGAAVGAAPLLLYNTLIFGSPTSSGYHQSLAETFTTPLLYGLNGLLLSPGKGLWLYAPPVALGLLGLAPFARRRPALAATVVGVVLPTLGLFALYHFWPGDGSWGPRYLLPLLPFLLLPAVALLPAAGAASAPFAAWPAPRRLLAGLILILGLAGLGVQALGAAVNFDTYINLVNDDATRYWNATYSPVRGHWTVLRQRLGAWLDRQAYPHAAVALLTGGFSYSEGDKYKAELFPRWTTGAATIALPEIAVYPLTLTLRVADHRPPALPRAELTVALAGAAIPAQREPVPGSGVESVVTARVDRPPGAAGRPLNLTLTTPTWNPKKAGAGARNEDLGLLIESLDLRGAGGQPLRLVDALPIQPMYPAPRWYYDTQSAHLLDLWAWYLAASGIPRRASGLLAALVLLPGLALVAWGAGHIRRAPAPGPASAPAVAGTGAQPAA
jgi:hypothetical protein